MTHLNTHSLSRSECLSLPPEINEHILGFIAADTVDIRYCVLHVYSLVCRAWRRICREAIFQDVLLGSSRQLLCISRTLTPKPGRETKIAIRSIAGWQSESDSPWLHLIPHYLATTAQLYGTEQLDLGGKDTELPFHPSLPIQLSRFRGVRVLHLHGIQFGTFNDLRRVVGAMPSLSEASLTRISWNNLRATSPHPLINATKWGVRDLKMLECQSDPFGIWFWVLPPLRAPSRSYRGLGDAGSHPGLTQEDVYHIIELLEAIPLNSHLQFEWNYQASGYWILSIYELLGNKAMFLHLWPHSYPFRLSSRQIPETVLVQATRIIFGASIGELLTYDWKTLDLRLWLLEDLKDVVLVFRSSGGSKPSRDQKYVREIAAKMPLVCRRCSLQFMIGSTAVPWDVLSEEADLEDGNLRDTQGEVDFNGILEDEFIEGLMSGKLSP